MKVPLVDHDGALKEMLVAHKISTNGALRFYRERIRIIASVTSKERQTEMNKTVRRLIEAMIKRHAPRAPRGSINLTTQNSVGAPLKEFMKRKGNRKRPPRYRRYDLRLRPEHAHLNEDAITPEILIGFQKETGRGVDLVPYRILGNERYMKRFAGMEHKVSFMTYKNGRAWLSMVFTEEVRCIDPEAIIGLDAGMYSNKSVWIGQLVDSNGNAATTPVRIPADEDPQVAAKQLVAMCIEHDAGLAIEDLKQLNRSRSGVRFGIPLSKYTTALVRACEDNAIPLYQVNPRNTSSMHHVCHRPLIRPKDERGWDFAICPHCNTEFSADENAAMNVALRGLEKRKEHDEHQPNDTGS